MELPPGIRSSTIDTARIRMHVLESGPADGEPLVLVHGNLSTARFYEHLMTELPDRFRRMVHQIRDVLDRYAAAGGSVRSEIIDGAGHSPHLEKPAEWLAVFTTFLATIG